MRTVVNPRHFYRLTLSAACLYGLGLTGCSRPSLDIGRDDLSAQTAMQERAAEAVQRSRQELLAQDQRAARAQGTNVTRSPKSTPDAEGLAAATAPETAPRSRFRMPVPRVLSSRRQDREKNVEDPFLAHAEREKKQSPAAKSDPVQDFLKEQRPSGVHSRASVVNFETDVKEDRESPPSSRTGVDPARPKTPGTTSSKTAIARKFDSAESRESRTLAGTTTPDRPKSRGAELARQEQPPVTDKSTRSSKAPPFPTTTETDVASVVPSRTGTAAPFPTSASERTPAAATQGRHKMRAAGNPLAIDAPVLTDDDDVKPSSKAPSPGVAIATLLDDARAATERGEFTKALELVADAQRLATDSGYVFERNEQQPADAIALIAHEIEDAQRLSRGELAGDTSKKARFSKASFSAGQHPEFPEPFTGSSPGTGTIAEAQPQRRADNPVAEPPVWPESTRLGVEDSNELWQPSAGLASLPQSKSSAAEAERFVMEVDSQLAAVHATGGTVEAAGTGSRPSWQAPTTQPVTVELGAPTPLAPDAVAFHTPPSRLVAPPPLAIGDLPQDISLQPLAAEPARQRTKSRMVWYAVFGSLAGVALLLYRRKAYGAQRTH